MAAVDLGVAWQFAQYRHHSCVHHLGGPLEESATSAEEESVTSEDDLLVVLGDVVADVASGVAGSEQTADLDTSHSQLVAVLDRPGR